MNISFRNRAVSALIMLLALGLLWGLPAYSKDAKKMAILPFTMNADKDLTFLQEGITDMLASRLAWKGEVDVLEKGLVKQEVAKVKGPLSKELALSIGKGLQVDYVILGSLTVFGDSVSIDAKILDVAKAEELVTAFNQAKGMDAVIPTVTQFAQDINEKVMSRPVAAPVRSGAQEAPRGPGGLIGAGQDFEGKGVGHTQALKLEVVSLDVGDVDGDGKNELVVVDKDTVYAYKWAEKGFVPLKSVKEKWGANYVYVSVADLDGNGKAEIYVSNSGTYAPSSFVLEWDGKDFRRIAEGLPWLFRVVEVPGRGHVLVGQKRETAGGFMGDVQYLRREGNQFVPTEGVPLPPYANVFSFLFADLRQGGRVDTLVMDTTDYLILYEAGTEEVWRSEDHFGGTYTSFEGDTADGSKDLFFIASPMYVVDADGDGQKEIMVCKNTSKLGRWTARARFYSAGTLHFLTRDQTGLSTRWSTKRLGGAMAGYRVADVNNDGKPDLIVASVIREERMVGGDPRSRIVVYDLK